MCSKYLANDETISQMAGALREITPYALDSQIWRAIAYHSAGIAIGDAVKFDLDAQRVETARRRAMAEAQRPLSVDRSVAPECWTMREFERSERE